MCCQPLLFDSSSPDIEMLVTAWMAPIGRTGAAFRTGDSLPFRLVTRIGGDENFWIREDEPLVSVHTLCDVSLGYATAAGEAQKTHDRMLELAWTLGPVTMPGGELVCVEYLKPFQYPRWLDYEDVTVLRKVGRYKIGTPYLRNGVE